MKTNFGRLLMTLGFSAVLGSSLIQAQSKARGRVEIPFTFHVRDAALPAGTYTVEEFVTTGTVLITNNETGKAVLTLAPANRAGDTDESKLVFNKYGDRYFLSELWFAGKGAGDCVPVGKLEREVRSSPPAIATVAMRQAP
jgi:hypothetical protein